jgi:ketosteroid isomerase-like protein
VRRARPKGFDAVAGEFRWDVPGLHVVVRDDLAVAWGLNRMRFRPPGGDEAVTWSRGTRVLRRVDGEWRTVHQQVSYPVDPTTGRALTDLAPDGN